MALSASNKVSANPDPGPGAHLHGGAVAPELASDARVGGREIDEAGGAMGRQRGEQVHAAAADLDDGLGAELLLLRVDGQLAVAIGAQEVATVYACRIEHLEVDPEVTTPR